MEMILGSFLAYYIMTVMKLQWLENQKYISNEVGFSTLTKEEVETQVEEIMKELVENRPGKKIVSSIIHI
jgi:hypothetical protein